MISKYEDLHRIFRDYISAREIAEPLAMFDSNHSAVSVREFMEAKGFDVVGVSVDGVPQGFVESKNLGEGRLGDFVLPFSRTTLLDEKTPLLEVLQLLTQQEFIFIRFLGNPGAIVTRSDLQKAPVRMWLFGLISILEIELLQMIKDQEKGDWWFEILTDGRRKGAQRIFDLRKSKGEEISKADCLQMCDKKEIFAANSDLLAKTGLSEDEWSSFMSKLEDLRNNLAHANEIDTGSWPTKADLALRTEELIRRLESR